MHSVIPAVGLELVAIKPEKELPLPKGAPSEAWGEIVKDILLGRVHLVPCILAFLAVAFIFVLTINLACPESIVFFFRFNHLRSLGTGNPC